MVNTERDDRLELSGIVVESNKGIFKVMVGEDHLVNCKLNGRLRINDIKVIVGDQVEICVSPYDLYTGRITKRLKTNS